MNCNEVLILDDSPEVCELIARTAQGCGFEAGSAHTPQHFYTAYLARDPGLLVLDVVLGERDVCEVFDFLSGCWNQAPLVLISAYDHRILKSMAALARDRNLFVIATIEKKFDLKPRLEPIFSSRRVYL